MCGPYDQSCRDYQENPGLKMTSVYAGFTDDGVSEVYAENINLLCFPL